jgi:hypothetical protein
MVQWVATESRALTLNLRRIGIALVGVAAVTWLGWITWARTRTWSPATVPLSLSAGSSTSTRDFRVNVDGRYEISIEATANGNVPLKELVCLLGLEPLWPDKTCSTDSVIRTSWIVTSHEMTVAGGLSDKKNGGWTAQGWSRAGRVIGQFNANKGQQYKVCVQTLADASRLSTVHPDLTVEFGGPNYESVAVVTSLLNFACAAMGILGVILLIISFS